MNFIFILKLILMSEINQLKHFYALDYEGEYFTNELKMVKNFFILLLKFKMIVKLHFYVNIIKINIFNLVIIVH